jgi:anaerobic ribonucleoside-triphosphate reductase activating protein
MSLYLKNNYLNINDICRKTTALGPGIRYVIWTQGCAKRCTGCLTPDGLLFQDKILLQPQEIAADILKVEGIEGVTISGGEPFLQAKNLTILIDLVKAKKDLSFIVYSGYTLEELKKMNSYSKLLLQKIDVLIDGEYVEELNDDKGLRGSSNQNIIFLSETYSDRIDQFNDCIREMDVRHKMLIGIKPKGFDAFIGSMMRFKSQSQIQK